MVNLDGLHRLPATGVALACVLLGCLLFATAPASAASQYPLVGEISLASTPESGLGGGAKPGGVAFGGGNGNIIVGSFGEIDAFGVSDELDWFVQTEQNLNSDRDVAVNEGTGQVYVAQGSGDIDVLSSTGEHLFEINGGGAGKPVPKGLTQPAAVAVDQATGDVYVYDKGTLGGGVSEAIDVFTATGEYLFQITSAGSNSLGPFVKGLAVDDATGELLVGDEPQNEESSVVYVLDAATGAYIATWSGAGTPRGSFTGGLRLAVDNATGDVYVAVDGLSGIESLNGKTFLDEEKQVPAVVDRFTATGEYESQITGLPGSAFQGGTLWGVAVSPVNGDVQVLQKCTVSEEFCQHPNPDPAGAVYVFAGSPVAVPHVSLAPPSSLKSRSVTLRGLVDPEGTGEASCEFEFGTSTTYSQRVPCTAHVPNGNMAVPVQAELSGLKSDTTYYYRLDAKNLVDGSTNLGVGSEDLGQVTTPGPKLVSEGVSAVTAESASFAATVMPNGLPSSAYFQYGTSEEYGSNIPVPPGVDLGAGTSEVEFSPHVQGLQAGTVYHYRLVVLSQLEPGKVEEVDGLDHTFTTQPAAAGFTLPDGRIWELVTPAEKHGALFYSQNYGNVGGVAADPLVGEASVNGDAMVDLASAPTEAEPAGYVTEATVLSTRGPQGWSSQVITPPHNSATGPGLGRGGEYEFFSENLSLSVVDPFGRFTALSPEASEPTPYLHSDYLDDDVSDHCESSCYTPLVTAVNSQSGVQFGQETEEEGGEGCKKPCGPDVVDATPDTSFVALSSGVQLTSAPNGREGNLQGSSYYYEWGSDQLQPLYLLPESEGGGGVNAGELSSVTHQLSEDGSVFFTYREHLYLHDFAKDRSVRLDVAQGAAEPSVGGAKFLYASSDGSRVLFSDRRHLTSAGKGGIYECRIVETGGLTACELKLTNISEGTLIGGSNDAAYIYFEDATEHLVVDHYRNGEWNDTRGPFVGTWPLAPGATKRPGFGSEVPVSRVSPDGRWLTFMSEEELTGYDNRDAVNGRRDVEVYLYNAVSNMLVCASCNPTGARPVGAEYNESDLVGGSLLGIGRDDTLAEEVPLWVAANLPPWTTANHEENRYQPRFLSDSGRLFFDSRDALVPQDVNGAQDVYEWEPPGVGDCTTGSAGFSERSGGCVGLISSGTSAEESAFMDASENGGDSFFITLAKLNSQDFDNALDVYDAHECTPQTPCSPPAGSVPPACSTGDGCKAAPTPQPPVFGAPSSATFSGAGNVNPSGSLRVLKSPKRKPLSRSQKLARALKACVRKGRAQRAGCERAARKRYGKLARHGKRG